MTPPDLFRAFLEAHRTRIEALKALSDPRSRKPLTPPMLKALQQALLAEDPAWDEETLWQAHAAAAPGKVEGASSPGRLADLIPLVRFSLGQTERLRPFAAQVGERFDGWVSRKNATFTRDQRDWLERIRDHIAASGSIDLEAIERAPFKPRGGRVKAFRLFGKRFAGMLEEMNVALAE